MRSLAEKIKTKAIEIGFQKAGIVRAEPLGQEVDRLSAWLGRGFHGEMAWMAREPEKRTDPNILFPEARSVIVCTLNYYTDNKHVPDPSRGKVSRYAWGDDYHDVMREKLDSLLAWLTIEVPDIKAKICVDTAPFMDKAWAVRAGLGWMGKSTNLITTDVGSWVFIGSLLVDIELEYDREIIDDHCGTCTACIDACPTNAIVQPYVVDSRRCLSYATIELRDAEIPADIASNMDGWLYGCDICQDVCPWNRFETPTNEGRFKPREGETSLDLSALADMEHQHYLTRFRGSAMKRAKLSGIKRNSASLKNS